MNENTQLLPQQEGKRLATFCFFFHACVCSLWFRDVKCNGTGAVASSLFNCLIDLILRLQLIEGMYLYFFDAGTATSLGRFVQSGFA